ncbi:MAG TPA: hypothetical protein VL422_13565 [Miltoncostaea sp.]|nr:hypothetical protein [Miltoncostaea sp.]
MRPDDAERRIAERMDEIPLPDGLEDRVRAVARDAARANAPAVRRRRRRRLWLIATAGLVLAGAGSATGYWLASRDDDYNLPAGPGARAAISESAVLARLPWLAIQPNGSPTLAGTEPEPSLAFPPGTTYAVAIDRLVRAVVVRGALPRGAILQDPLPAGVVWAPAAPGSRPRLDLRAPFGYPPSTGTILTASYSIPGDLPFARRRAVERATAGIRLRGGPLPRGLRVAPQALAPCQVLLPGERNVPCPAATEGR